MLVRTKQMSNRKVKVKQMSKRKKRENALGLGLVSIHFVGFALFTLVPLILSVVMAFSTFKGSSARLDSMQFCGLDNFKFIFTEAGTWGDNESPNIWLATGNTFFLCLSIPFEIFFGLIFAQLLKEKIKFKKFFRVTFYMPYICSIVAVAFVWRYLFSGDAADADGTISYGLINQIIQAINPNAERIMFLQDQNWTKPVLILMTLWSVLGYDMLLFQAALENIDHSIYEAADIDGASKVQQFFKITVPLVTPTIFFLLITCVIGALQSFTKMDSLIGLGNNVQYGTYGDYNSAMTLVAYIMYWKEHTPKAGTFDGGRLVAKSVSGLGIACAATLFLTLIIAIITFINRKLSDKWVQYND